MSDGSDSDGAALQRPDDAAVTAAALCQPASQTAKAKRPLALSDPKEYGRRMCKLYAGSAAVILGNIMEWYDWTIYGSMEDLIAEIFMGGKHEATWLVFAVPFVARPLGSLLLGWVGDRFGRTIALNLAIWGMAMSTCLQGCIPNGMPGAAGVLAALRFLSGISAGGEAAGVNTYMTEVGGPERDQTLAAAVGVNNVSGSIAFFLATFASVLVHQLPKSDQLAWAWRLPFLAAAPIGIVSVLLRRRMHETEAFEAVRAARRQEPVAGKLMASVAHQITADDTPATGSVGNLEESASTKSSSGGGDEEKITTPMHRSPKREPSSSRSPKHDFSDEATEHLAQSSWGENFLAIASVVVVLAAINSVNYFPLYLARWLQSSCGFSTLEGLCVAGLCKITQLLMTFPVSFLGDRIGLTKTMLIGGAMSMLSLIPALFLVLAVIGGEDDVAGKASDGADLAPRPSTTSYAVAFIVFVGWLPIPTSLYSILSPLYLTSLFPANFRGRGAGIGLGLASLAGGFTPAICNALAAQHAWLPGLFVTSLAVPSMCVLLWSKRAASRGGLRVHQRPWLF